MNMIYRRKTLMSFDNRKILIVLAHPDDEWFLLQKIKSAKSADVLILTTPKKDFEQRKADTLAIVARPEFNRISIKFLADKVEIMDSECLAFVSKLADEINVMIKKTKPELIITHDYEHGHPDHDASFLSTLIASEINKHNLLCFCSYRKSPTGLLSFFKPLPSKSNQVKLNYSFFDIIKMFWLSQLYKSEKFTMSVLGTFGLLALFIRGGIHLRNINHKDIELPLPSENSLVKSRYKRTNEQYREAICIVKKSIRL